jgi:protein-disulfide isomerase
MNLKWSLSFIVVVAASSLTACSKATPEKAQAATASADARIPDVLATVGNEKITMADIQSRSGDDLERLQTQYELGRSLIIERTLNSILKEKVIDEEAKKQGKTYEDLVAAEAGIGINPSDADIAKWYQENPSRTGGRSLEELKGQIAELIRNQRRTAAEESLQARLNKERNVLVAYRPYTFSFDNGDAPSLGKKDAPVTLVEFSDFQCPFCNRFAPTLKQVKNKYGDKVHIVYRQYPIPSLHPFAFKAAEASLCANDQGKFWELHDAMFSDQTKLSVADLKKRAVSLGMDAKKFNACLDTGHYTEQVQKDMAEGAKIGITGTPAVFVNGIELKGGAVPFETVASAIDRELARAKTN